MGTFGKNVWKWKRPRRRFTVMTKPPPASPQAVAVNDYKGKQLAEEIPQPLLRPEKARII